MSALQTQIQNQNQNQNQNQIQTQNQAHTQQQLQNGGLRLPSDATLQHAAKLGIVEDKPILFDYWAFSLDKKVLVGVKDNKEKLLVKSEEEYTSPIAKIFKTGQEYIIMTENSIYIVDAAIPTKRIT